MQTGMSCYKVQHSMHTECRSVCDHFEPYDIVQGSRSHASIKVRLFVKSKLLCQKTVPESFLTHLKSNPLLVVR